jgi:hypothetical protein
VTRDDARRGNLREHGEPERGIYFGRDRKQPTGDGVLVHIAREAPAIRLRDTAGSTVEAFGDTTRFWLAPAPTEPSPLAGAAGEAAPSPCVPAACSRPPDAATVPAEQAATAPAGLIAAVTAAEEQLAARTADLARSYRLTAEAITAAGATPTPKRQTWAAAGHPETFLYFERDIRPGRPILATTRDGYRIHDLRTGQLIAHYASPVPMWIAAVPAPVAPTPIPIIVVTGVRAGSR